MSHLESTMSCQTILNKIRHAIYKLQRFKKITQFLIYPIIVVTLLLNANKFQQFCSLTSAMIVSVHRCAQILLVLTEISQPLL